MIIPDEDDIQKIKNPAVAVPTVRHPEPAASRHLGTLPDYETSQAFAFRDFSDSQVTLYKPPPGRRLVDSRFWRAALISLVVYIFLTLIIAVPIIVHKDYENDQKYPYNALSYALAWGNKSYGSHHPDNANVSSPVQSRAYPVCNNWTQVEYHDVSDGPVVLAVAEHYVSPNGQFSFTANISTSDDFNPVQGAFYAGINPNNTVQDAVLSIIMQSSSPPVFIQAYNCLATTDNFTDLSLYVPNNFNSTDSILYNISILFPQTAAPSQVDCFTTFLPMFDQRFGSFDDSVVFDRVSIGGTVSRVTVASIQANRLIVDTSLEPVVGTFHAQTSLFISTIMAPITVNISLYNDPKSQFPTFLDVHTGNSNLTANVTLAAPNTITPPRPNFIANLRTFTGSLSTTVSHGQSSPSIVELNVINDLGPTNVVLDSLFQGIFQVSTKRAYASVMQGDASEPNPWSPGQSRTMLMDSNSTMRSSGWIGWGNDVTPWNAYEQGEVLVSSSLANVTLFFLG